MNDTAMTIEEGDCPDERGPMMVAQVGAEAICRENRRYSRVRIGDIRMNRQQFAAAIRPISTRGLWNDDVPWTFFGVWDDNYLSIGRDYWMSGHLSLNIRFNQEPGPGSRRRGLDTPAGRVHRPSCGGRGKLHVPDNERIQAGCC